MKTIVGAGLAENGHGKEIHAKPLAWHSPPAPLNASLGSPDDGARLIRAFLSVKNSHLRSSILRFVEDLAKTT
jgi:hypothetical protein